jgi:hypothetical protein
MSEHLRNLKDTSLSIDWPHAMMWVEL